MKAQRIKPKWNLALRLDARSAVSRFNKQFPMSNYIRIPKIIGATDMIKRKECFMNLDGE